MAKAKFSACGVNGTFGAGVAGVVAGASRWGREILLDVSGVRAITSWAAGTGVGDGLGAAIVSGEVAMGAAVESAALADCTTGCVDLSLRAARFEDVAIGLGSGLATDASGWSAGVDAGVEIGTGNDVGSGDAVCSFAEGVGAAVSEDFAVATGDNFGVRTPGTVTREASTSAGVSARDVTCCGVGAAL